MAKKILVSCDGALSPIIQAFFTEHKVPWISPFTNLIVTTGNIYHYYHKPGIGRDFDELAGNIYAVCSEKANEILHVYVQQFDDEETGFRNTLLDIPPAHNTIVDTGHEP